MNFIVERKHFNKVFKNSILGFPFQSFPQIPIQIKLTHDCCFFSNFSGVLWAGSACDRSMNYTGVVSCSLTGWKNRQSHMRIRYHFKANLPITETQSILFLTQYDKNNIIGWAKAHSKAGFSVSDWKSSKTLRRLKRNSRWTSISGWGKLFSK